MKTTLHRLALLAALASSAHANLVSHWSFDTADGTVVADSQGNFTGTLSGTTPYVGGLFGQALSFDSSLGSYVSLGNDPSLNWVGGEFSFSLWLKTTTANNATFLFAKHESGSSNGYLGALNTHGDGGFGNADSPSFYLTGSDISASSITVNDGAWHHLAFTYAAGGSAALYIDGALDALAPVAPPLSPNAAQLYLGALSASGSPVASYTGLLDEVRLYNHALSVGEVTSLATAIPEPASCAALAGLATLGLAASRRRRGQR